MILGNRNKMRPALFSQETLFYIVGWAEWSR